jgi:predicted nuclease of restriction endonuclease-like (RecB) superfamily
MPDVIWKIAIRQKSQTASGELTMNSPSLPTWQMPSAKSSFPFKLSWSQYVFLISIENPEERNFYEIEAALNGWALPELKRQFTSGVYERLALSRDKDDIRKLAREGQIVTRPQDLLKEPYVLEFLGLDEKAKYSESDLESAIINKLEHVLLELGKGFLFEVRQKRFTFDEEHFFVDLVFPMIPNVGWIVYWQRIAQAEMPYLTSFSSSGPFKSFHLSPRCYLTYDAENWV